MIPLNPEYAVLLVRKNLDEVQGNDSDMAGLNDIDSDNFEEIVRNTLPDAINDIHLLAPASLLSGRVLSEGDINDMTFEDNVLTIPVTGFLRLVAFQPIDSPYVVTDPVAEYSAEGRMQLNRYTRATPDRPVLVKVQGTDNEVEENGRTFFKYYGMSTFVGPYVKVFRYVERCKVEDADYYVSELLVDKVVDRLTGMVAAIFNDSRADYFLKRSSFQADDEKNNKA